MILLDGKVGMTSFTLDISDFPPGIYLITLNTANGTIVKKIIKSGV